MTTTDRADFLRNLPAADFCPPEGHVAALGLPATADALTRRAEDTRCAVDDFADRYWSLDPDDRQAEWKRLSTRPADAPTMAFLTHLKGGLAVGPAPATPDDPALTDLGAITRELFTLRPRPRSARRVAWLDTREASVNWPEAIGRLWATDSAAAELDPPLVSFLDDESAPPTSVGPLRGNSIYSSTYGRAESVDSRSPGQDSYRPRPRVRESDSESSSGGSPWVGRLGIGGAVAIVIVVIRVVVGCAGGLNKSPSNSPSYTPSYTPSYVAPPTFNTLPTRFGANPNAGGQTTTFTNDQVLNFKIHESVKRNVPPPARYDDWVRAGRPAAGVPVPSGSSRP